MTAVGLRLSLFMRLRHYPFVFRTVQAIFDHVPMVLSVSLHLFVIFLLTYDFYTESKDKVVSVPMFVVDLTDVKIGPMTNLPPKLIEGKKKTSKSKRLKTSAYSTAKGGKKASGGAVRGGAGTGEASSASGARLESELNSMLEGISSKKSGKKDATPSNSVKSAGDGSAGGDAFKTLLASVDGIRGGMGYSSEQPDIPAEERENDGIEGGSGGSYIRELSVSDRDMLGLKLRQCWNLDPGVRGVKDMSIEIRAYLNRDGTVKDTKILNSRRSSSNPAFRSVAESARRAIYICDKQGDASPFKIFPKYYERAYDDWKTLKLRFNPFDGGVL